jgi:hypothetical protein
MRLRFVGTFASVAASLLIGGSAAGAQDADDGGGDEDPDPATARPEEQRTREGIEGGAFDDYETVEVREKQLAAEYGLGLRVRTIYVPKFALELFVDEASGSVLRPGFGLEFSRRKGNFELVLGVEYENLSPSDGFWLGKDSDPNVPEEAPDYFDFDDFSWVAADLAVLWNAPLSDVLSFRYGFGLGIGLVLGDVLQTDATCAPGTDDIQEDCMVDRNGMQVDDPADFPPVLPVVDLLAGLQWKPAEKVTINFETGFRSAAFLGLSTNFYF